MAGLFLSQRGMAETRKSEATANAWRKREGLEYHPLRPARKCGCSADCGAFYTVNTDVDMRDIKLDKPAKPVYDECYAFETPKAKGKL